VCCALSVQFQTDVMTTTLRVASHMPTSQLELVGNATPCSSSLYPSQIDFVGNAMAWPSPRIVQASARKNPVCYTLNLLFRTDVMTANFRVASRLPTSQLELVGNATPCSSSLPTSQPELVGKAMPHFTAVHADTSIQLAQFMQPPSSLPSPPQ